MSLQGVARWSLCLALSAAACTPPAAGTTAATQGQESRDDLLPPRVIESLIREAEATRELDLLEPIETVTMTSGEIRAFVREKMDEVEMGQAQQIMEAFGFIPPGLDVEQQLEDILAAEVVGLYDSRTGRLVVLRSVAEELASQTPEALMARMVLIHELAHALQDQHFETLEHTGEEAWSDDAETVFTCLAEGDATLTMMASIFRQTGRPDRTLAPGLREELRGQAGGAMPSSSTLLQAPPYFAHVMGAMYLEGAGFVADLRRLGGWRAVDEAHRRPPRSTRDILETEAYLSGRALVELALPEPIEALEREGFHQVATARLGQLETGAFLLPLADELRIREAASGWAGDRFAVYSDETGRTALVWRLRFEDEVEAQEFHEAAVEATVAAGRGPCEAARPMAARCHGGLDWLEQRGSDVVVLREVPSQQEALAEALFAAPAEQRAVAPPQPELLDRLQAEGATP